MVTNLLFLLLNSRLLWVQQPEVRTLFPVRSRSNQNFLKLESFFQFAQDILATHLQSLKWRKVWPSLIFGWSSMQLGGGLCDPYNSGYSDSIHIVYQDILIPFHIVYQEITSQEANSTEKHPYSNSCKALSLVPSSIAEGMTLFTLHTYKTHHCSCAVWPHWATVH